jgi:hypothetical protein
MDDEGGKRFVELRAFTVFNVNQPDNSSILEHDVILIGK